MVMKRETKIKKQFDTQGREIAEYIRQNSEQNVQRFISEVDKLIDKIEENPKAFPSELYLPTNNNLYRFSIVMKSWKIIFKVTNKLLIFLGIIHTARHTKEIKKLRTNNYE